jgi:hypothetical protein
MIGAKSSLESLKELTVNLKTIRVKCLKHLMLRSCIDVIYIDVTYCHVYGIFYYNRSILYLQRQNKERRIMSS